MQILPEIILLLERLALPFVLFLAAGGIFALLALRFAPLKNAFWFIRTIGGVEGSVPTGRRISTARAAAAAVPAYFSTFLGTVFAIHLTSPGILVYILLFSLPVWFLSSVSVLWSGRSVFESAKKAGLPVWLQIPWLLTFIICAYLAGGAVPVAAFQLILPEGGSAVSAVFSPVLLLVAVAFILAGGTRRIAFLSKYRVLFTIVIFIIILFTSPVSFSHYFASVARSIPPFSSDVVLAIAVFFAFSEMPGGRFQGVLGMTRNASKKDHLSVATVHTFSAVGFAFITGYILSGISVPAGNLPFESAMSDIFRIGDLTDRNGSLIVSAFWPAVIVYGILTASASWCMSSSMAVLVYKNKTVHRIFVSFFTVAVLCVSYFIYKGGESAVLDTLLLTAAAFIIYGLFSAVAAILFAFRNSRVLHSQHDGRAFLSVKESAFLALLVSIPKNLASRLFGIVAAVRWPSKINRFILRKFAEAFHIDLTEADGPIESYKSLNLFFTRKLKPDVRTIDTQRKSIVSPVDARVSEFGPVQNGKLIQAKGIHYSVADLIGNTEEAVPYLGGSYIVLYLSPQDYHRMHSPADCEITGYRYLPGRLFPVNALAVKSVQDLFPKNERLTSYLSSAQGRIAFIKVGATNVGKITLSYEKQTTNRWVRIARRIVYDEPLKVKKGEELAVFEMGSTVVLLFEAGCAEIDEAVHTGMKVQLGQRIAKWVK